LSEREDGMKMAKDRWAAAGVAILAALILAAPTPAAADGGMALMVNGGLGAGIAAVNTGLAIASAVDMARPQPNRALAGSSVAFGTLGLLSGVASLTYGIWGACQPDNSDDNPHYNQGMGTMWIVAGMISAADGALALGLGIHNLMRPGHKVPPLPMPVVLGDRRTGPLPGLAWNIRF